MKNKEKEEVCKPSIDFIIDDLGEASKLLYLANEARLGNMCKSAIYELNNLQQENTQLKKQIDEAIKYIEENSDYEEQRRWNRR